MLFKSVTSSSDCKLGTQARIKNQIFQTVDNNQLLQQNARRHGGLLFQVFYSEKNQILPGLKLQPPYGITGDTLWDSYPGCVFMDRWLLCLHSQLISSETAIEQKLDRWCWNISMPALSLTSSDKHTHSFPQSKIQNCIHQELYLTLSNTVHAATLLLFSHVLFPTSLWKGKRSLLK